MFSINRHAPEVLCTGWLWVVVDGLWTVVDGFVDGYASGLTTPMIAAPPDNQNRVPTMNAHSYWRTTRAAAISLVAALTLGAGTASVTGRGVRAPTPAHSTIRARDLLLQNGDTTPLGRQLPTLWAKLFHQRPAIRMRAGTAFKGSPLPPAVASDHAESAYTFGGKALYAESVDLYTKP